MKKTIIRATLLFMILQSGLSSCKKMDIEKDAPAPVTTKTTFDVKAPENFKWNTVHAINLTIKPIAGDGRVDVLKLAFDDGVILYQKLQKASVSQSILLEIPAQYTKVNVSFGSITKTFTTQNTNVQIDLN